METMETTIPETYSPNQLVTYKVIDGSQVTYVTEKLVNIEYELHGVRQQRDKISSLQSKINLIIDNLTRDYWFSDNVDKDEVLNELCEILDHEPKQEVEFNGVIHFRGRVDIPINEDFDLESILSDAYVDINNGDVTIDDYELYSVEEC